ncbi:MAG: glycosyltransferase [Planctomycetota bacterium]
MPELSIIIPTRHRPELLQRVVQALLRQSVAQERYELIIVDSASTDSTPELLAQLSAKHSNLKTLRTDKAGAAAARNLGLEAANSPLLVLLDDDILVSEDFLAHVLAGAQAHPDRILLGKIVAPWIESCDPFQRFLLESGDVNTYDFPDRLNVPANHFYTACVAIPRQVLSAIRFDEKFIVYGLEDLDFGLRLLQSGEMIVYLPELEVRHEYFPNFRDYRRKKYKTGYSLAYFINKQPDNARHFYIESNLQRILFRVYRLLASPAAGVAYLYDRMARRTGPIHRVLYHWFYCDLRVQLFNGMRRFQAEDKSQC